MAFFCSFYGYYSVAYMYHIFVHSSVDGHLGCFNVLIIVNSAALNIRVHISIWGMVFFSNMPRNRRRQWQATPVLLPGKSHGWRSLVGCSPWGHYESDTTERLHFHTVEKAMATHSSVLAWRIPGTGEPGGLPSMGSHRVGHDWSDLAAAAAACQGMGLLDHMVALFWVF